MAKRRPAAMVRLDRGRLTPVTAWDAELLADERNGQEYDLVRRTKRSTPHNSKYWAQLGAIVKATEAFATPDHMHDWIKVELGYTKDIISPSGEVICKVVDSTAFEKMDQAAFNVFYEKAVQLVAQEMGIDMEQARG